MAGTPTIQQRLFDDADSADWVIDDDTRIVGRRGLAEARAALAAAARRAAEREAREAA